MTIEYSQILEKLRADIELRTGIITRFEIDNQNSGDTPTITVGLIGTLGVKMNPSKIIQSQTVLFSLKLNAKAANPANLADIISSEAQISLVFPMSLELKAVLSERYYLSETNGYNVSYYAKWSNGNIEMSSDDFERKWDLIMNITIKR